MTKHNLHFKTPIALVINTSIHTYPPPTHTHTHNNIYQTGLVGGCKQSKCQPYLQQFDALCECSSVKAGLAACSIDVALDSVMRLAARFVEGAQIHPGSCVAVVQLNSTDVGLQCIHRLVLLLVEHPEDRGKEGRSFSSRIEVICLSYPISHRVPEDIYHTSIHPSPTPYVALQLVCLHEVFGEPPQTTERNLIDGSIPMFLTFTMPLSISIYYKSCPYPMEHHVSALASDLSMD